MPVPGEGLGAEEGLFQQQDVPTQGFRAAFGEKGQIARGLVGHDLGGPGEQRFPSGYGVPFGVGTLYLGDGPSEGIGRWKPPLLNPTRNLIFTSILKSNLGLILLEGILVWDLIAILDRPA